MGHLDTPYIREEKDITPEIAADPRRAWPFSPHPTCRGVKRLRLNEAQRLRVRPLWPDDHPRFWAPDEGLREELRFRMLTDRRSMDLSHYGESDAKDQLRDIPAVYPTSIDYGLARLSRKTGQEKSYFLDVLVGDGVSNKGFVYCDSEAPDPLESLITGHDVSSYLRSLKRCRIEGFVVPVKLTQCDGPWWIAFENDEYAIVALEGFSI
jgi:hypothetical protein